MKEEEEVECIGQPAAASLDNSLTMVSGMVAMTCCRPASAAAAAPNASAAAAAPDARCSCSIARERMRREEGMLWCRDSSIQRFMSPLL